MSVVRALCICDMCPLLNKDILHKKYPVGSFRIDLTTTSTVIVKSSKLIIYVLPYSTCRYTVL